MAERKPRPKEDVVYFEEPERLAIIARMKEKGISRAQLARDCEVSAGAITLLLKPIPKGKRRACRYASKLQRALDFALTTKPPSVLPREPVHRAQKIIKTLQNDPEALENWLHQGEWTARKASE